ncbi:hypothetical protein [Arthrobacter pigmenti]
MRNFFSKSLAVGTVSGLMLVGGAGMASADTGDHTDTRVNETSSQVTDNRIVDSGNLSLDNLLNDAVDVGDVASGNNVLSGIDADVSDNLDGIASGNDADVDANPDVDSSVDADADASSESTSVSDQDNEALLGGLL